MTRSLDGEVINIKFDDEGAVQWAIITSENVGKRIALILDGIVLTLSFVLESITNGQLQIPMISRGKGNCGNFKAREV